MTEPVPVTRTRLSAWRLPRQLPAGRRLSRPRPLPLSLPLPRSRSPALRTRAGFRRGHLVERARIRGTAPSTACHALAPCVHRPLQPRRPRGT